MTACGGRDAGEKGEPVFSPARLQRGGYLFFAVFLAGFLAVFLTGFFAAFFVVFFAVFFTGMFAPFIS